VTDARPLPSVVFPADVDHLTPEVFTAALAATHPGVIVDELEVVAAKRCGDGVASTADRVVVDLTYRPGTAGELPRRLILKTMLATPHAPAAMYENEVRFYTELRPGLPIEAPTAFGGSFDPSTGRFGLLLEDLGARGARAAVVITAGFDSSLRDAMLAAGRPHTIRIVGPNCLGSLTLPSAASMRVSHT